MLGISSISGRRKRRRHVTTITMTHRGVSADGYLLSGGVELSNDLTFQITDSTAAGADPRA
jgi:hypothetical protein